MDITLKSRISLFRLHALYKSTYSQKEESDAAGRDSIQLTQGHLCYLPAFLIALQHISDPVLKRMHRNITAAETREFLSRIREEVPGIHLRTTLMVGFPGETDDDYSQLLDFVREQRFERMGAFAYCEVDGTYSALHYKDDITDEIKQLRLSRLMSIQQDISASISQSKVGGIYKTVIDRLEGDYYVGRTEFDSPEVDPEVLIHADDELRVGNFYPVKVTEADAFDLYGKVM